MHTSKRTEPWGLIAYDRDQDEFEAYLNGPGVPMLVSRPLSAGCLVTGKCNLRCSHCYGDEESLPSIELDVHGWIEVFRRLRSWDVMRVDLSGGEPTMRADLADIALAARDIGLAVVISTNGMPLARRGVAGFPLVRWHVSMDSGLQEIHEQRRLLPVLKPSRNSLERASTFIKHCLDAGCHVRVLTSIGSDNCNALLALGEHLALIGVREWNISRVIRAGRAQVDYLQKWHVSDEYVRDQVSDLRCAFPFIRIRYSDRTQHDGYFLLVLPDGTLATQYTDGRDKIPLGKVADLRLEQLQHDSRFDLRLHGEKWISAAFDLPPQPFFQIAGPIGGGIGAVV